MVPAMTDWKTTACILCECNCGIEVQVGGQDGRELIRFRGDKAHPASQGYACEKPQRLNYYQNGRDRLTSPLRRRSDGSFEAISWDVAIAEVAQRLATVRDDHGGDAIFYYGGGGQGNHLGGAYASATRRVLKSRYRSNALAQEKTGEFWVSSRMLGSFTRSDFEHCEVGIFLGKNPWHSHGIPRARVTLKEMSKDPRRTLIVIDPRRSETAALADIHLQVRPGTDAHLLLALGAVLVEQDVLDHAFLAAHTTGQEPVLELLRSVSIADCCARSGVPEALVREAAMAIGTASSVASFEDLGVQMNRNSTLVSYLHRFLWVLTGNFGKPGTQYVPTPLVSIAGAPGRSKERVSPVAGARIVSGLVPCNVIAEEILADHPKRYRAMIVDAANPAHSLADSKHMREALSALETLVVIDVAMTETAQLADYVLPASTQFEKAEATFFNFEFPHNYFHLRPPLLAPLEGTLPEAEIHSRLVEALGALDPELIGALREAASEGLDRFAAEFFTRVMSGPLMGLAPVILYRSLAHVLPHGLAEGAVVWGLTLKAAMETPDSLARAGFEGGPGDASQKLFAAILNSPSGLVFAIDEWATCFDRLTGGRIELALPDLLADAAALLRTPAPDGVDGFPFVLSAGERRSFTANTILRNPAWRRKGADGALRISPTDAGNLAVGTGDTVRLTTRRDSLVVAVEVSDTMQPGHVSLPNGLGTAYPDEAAPGVAPNELTASEDRDPYVGTPWHKRVPARIERS